jgi:3-(3-hydroxy-phenyl)propionate hydroxylase
MAQSVGKCDVLIAGFGPVGAALAVYLGRLGISVIAVDRDTEVYPMPRAAHLDHETMRLLHLAGGAEAVSRASQPLSAYEFRAGNGELLMGFRPTAALAPTGFPESSMFHQPALENALRAAAAECRTVSISLGTALKGFTAREDGVNAELAGPEGERHVEARYLIGCDGGQSIVRRLLGVSFEDMGFDEPWLVVDAKLKDGRERFTTVGYQHCDPERPVTSVPMSPGRHRWEFMLRPGETPEEVTTDAFLAKLIAPFTDPASVEIDRRAVYRFHAVIAKEWRKGRVILAGDAAHQMPPFMGQGLCSGTRDAANLAWKLAALIKGYGSDALLDSYQRERAPHVKGITEMAVFMGRVVCTQDKAAAAARDRDMLAKPEAERFSAMAMLSGIASGILSGDPAAGGIFPEPWTTVDGVRRRLDDVAGLAPLLVHRGASEAEIAPFAAVGGFAIPLDRLTDEGGHLSALMGESAALLVRPDRYVFGRGDAASLIAAWRRYLETGAA